MRALALVQSRDYGREMRDGGKHGYGGGRGEKGFVVSKDSIKDERWFKAKEQVDKRLKFLVRDTVMRELGKGNGAGKSREMRCQGCGRYLGSGLFCSGCGMKVGTR